MLLITYKMEDK